MAFQWLSAFGCAGALALLVADIKQIVDRVVWILMVPTLILIVISYLDLCAAKEKCEFSQIEFKEVLFCATPFLHCPISDHVVRREREKNERHLAEERVKTEKLRLEVGRQQPQEVPQHPVAAKFKTLVAPECEKLGCLVTK